MFMRTWKSGYSLTELAMCIGILGIMAVVAMLGALQYRLRNEAAECRGNIQLLYHALNEYALDFQLARGTTVTVAQLMPHYLPPTQRITCPATTGTSYGASLVVGSVPVCPAGIARHRWQPSEAPGL